MEEIFWVNVWGKMRVCPKIKATFFAQGKGGERNAFPTFQRYPEEKEIMSDVFTKFLEN